MENLKSACSAVIAFSFFLLGAISSRVGGGTGLVGGGVGTVISSALAEVLIRLHFV